MNATRKEVYAAIDSERSYQITKWGTDADASMGNYLTYIQYYVDQAVQEFTKGSGTLGLADIRRVAALTVACMEYNGVVSR